MRQEKIIRHSRDRREGEVKRRIQEEELIILVNVPSRINNPYH